MIGLLELDRRHVAERFEQAALVVPRDPLLGHRAGWGAHLAKAVRMIGYCPVTPGMSRRP
jgi:hypothetical protein